ncbi:MAG: hypothetical protein PGN07_08140 [Aeromicrobium erythreum]
MNQRTLRSPLVRAAVTSVALLAGAVSVASPALADETSDPAQEGGSSTSETQSDAGDPAPQEEQSPAEQPQDPAPHEEQPAPQEQEPAPATDQAPAPQEQQPAPSAAKAAEAEPVEPNYGLSKFRVASRVKPGAFVPDGATTAGSVMRIVIKDADGATVANETCTTVDTTPDDPTDPAFCPAGNPFLGSSARKAARAVAQKIDVEPIDGTPTNAFLLFPGYSATITQVSAPSPFVADTGSTTVGPCTIDLDEVGGIEDYVCEKSDVFFTLAPPGPTVGTEKVGAQSGERQVFDVLDGVDSNGAPITGLSIVSGPQHGSASVVGSTAPSSSRRAAAAAGTGPQIAYRSKAGFAGVDSLRFRVTTPNGSAVGTLRITVRGATVDRGSDDTASTASTTAASTNATLPDTGAPGFGLAGWGAALVVAGAAAVASGRRRPESVRD